MLSALTMDLEHFEKLKETEVLTWVLKGKLSQHSELEQALLLLCGSDIFTVA